MITIIIVGFTPIGFANAITQNQINAEVQIVCPDDYGNWFSGSGTIIDPKGIILTNKHVVTDEKGGTIISVSHTTHKPIFYLGTGQEYKDLKLFNKQEFIESLGL